MVRTKPSAGTDTRTRILDTAERLLQTRGYNGFSYADVANELKITTATLHYHFAGKAMLGLALIERYTARFSGSLGNIEGRLEDAPSRLEAYVSLYAAVLREGRLCLCGMLAAEFPTLPKQMRDAVIRFFDENEEWLERVVGQGRERAELRFEGTPEEAARMIVSGLEGAMLVARPYGGLARFQSAADQLVGGLVRRPVSTGLPAPP